MQLKTKQAFYAIVLVLMVCGFLEIALGLLSFVSPRVERLLATPVISPTVPDARLRYRPNPAYPGHDSKGFRNLKSPTKAQIVALGDSQTYGEGVAAKDAWPRRLESMIGKTVYNMAYGGCGPTHGLILWDEVVALQPNVVIEAFYAGNDLFDSFDLVYNWKQLSELRSPDPTLQASIREAEQSEPIEKRVDKISLSSSRRRDGFSPWKFLSQKSKIYGLLRRTKFESCAWLINLTTILKIYEKTIFKKHGIRKRLLRKRIQHTVRYLAMDSSKPFLQVSFVYRRLISVIQELQKGSRFH